jgi:hypothetical protein
LFAGDGVTVVQPSIDPFFFSLTELAADADVYVADWTDSATVFDFGVEPSSEPVFYNRSDVWNRNANAPGAFDASNRPVNELPRNGVGALGDNFAFARIRRRATGSAQAVTAHFLVSPFGTGSNYQDAGTTADPVVNLAAVDGVITMAAGYPWHLGPTTSSHLCLAVEISTAQDPIVSPSLLGRAPGWPTTDLLVINDNNKAQRNMGVAPTTIGGWLTWYALIHNAATFRRDVVLRWQRQGAAGLAADRIQLIGGKPLALKESGQLVVPKLQAGESRFIRVSLFAGKGQKQDALVVFDEMVGHLAVNGFAISMQSRSPAEVAGHLLQRAVSVYTRAQALGVREAAALIKQARTLLKAKPSDKTYVKFARGSVDVDAQIAKQFGARLGSGDPFGLADSQKGLTDALAAGNVAAILSHHGAFLESVDSLLTTLDRRDGDLGDVCQNLRWQAELFGTRRLARVASAKRVVALSEKFVDAFGERNVTVADYPALMKSLVPALKAAATALKSDPLAKQVGPIADALHDAKALQRRHWEYLDTLAGIVGA